MRKIHYFPPSTNMEILLYFDNSKLGDQRLFNGLKLALPAQPGNPCAYKAHDPSLAIIVQNPWISCLNTKVLRIMLFYLANKGMN